MKVLIARLNHETNTFSPVPTPLEAFEPQFGSDAYRAQKGMRTAMSAFIDLAEAEGAELVTPVSAAANPSGQVQATAYDALCDRIVQACPGCDAILLDLHGAMVCENSADGEGDLLARVRAAAPDAPIGLALDLHGNITQKIVDHADVIVGFKTYPHIDMYETGEHAGRLLLAMARDGQRHVVLWKRLPLMSHTLRSTTLSGAMQEAVTSARAAEASGVAAVSVFAGFALADIEAPCVSVVVTTADTPEAKAGAQASLGMLSEKIWASRTGFTYNSEPLQASLARARVAADGADRPVLLLDHSDNCMSGGTCDTMDVLQAALANGLSDIAVGPLCDPEAVRILARAGVGAEVELPLGNKINLTSIGVNKKPIVLRGTVRFVSDGEYIVTGPTYTGMRCSMGRSVHFDAGAAQIVVTERTQEPWDIGVFSCVRLDPTRHRFMLLKSRMYCRPVFGPLSAALIECDSAGVTSSDYTLFPFQNVHRPVYPLDPL